MTLKEAVQSGRQCKRTKYISMSYGSISDKLTFHFVDSISNDEVSVPLTLEDITADDWELKPEARVYWLGVRRVQTPTKMVDILQAILGDKPDHKTGDGNDWIKVVEVLKDIEETE